MQKQIQAVTIIPQPFLKDRKKSLVPKPVFYVFLKIALVVFSGMNMEINVMCDRGKYLYNVKI